MGFGSIIPASTQYLSRGLGTGVGTTVTPSASVHVKGSYANIGSTLSFALDGFFVDISSNSGGGTSRFRVDIAINTGGSDQIIAEDLRFNPNFPGVYQADHPSIWCPVRVPSGSQIKARCSSVTGGGTVNVSINGFSGDARLLRGGRALRSFTDWTNTDATGVLTLNGTTLTGWTQIIASTPEVCAGLVMRLDDRGSQATISNAWFELGMGGAGSETSLGIFYQIVLNGTQNPMRSLMPVAIPASTRLAFRAQAAAADTNTISMMLWGVVP